MSLRISLTEREVEQLLDTLEQVQLLSGDREELDVCASVHAKIWRAWTPSA